MSVVLSEHLPLLASAPDGIQKLRGLILELAVRGKLVSQEPDSDQSNWKRGLFSEFFSLEYGDNLPAPKRTGTGEYPVYGSNGVVGTHNECRVLAPCIVVGRKGSAGALNLCREPGCWVTDVAYYCIPPNGVDLDFAFVLFLTLGLDDLGKGIKPGLSRNDAYSLPVEIPPLAEQLRIVAKVDELMALCDLLEAEQADAVSAHARLVETLLGTLTQSTNADDLAANWQRLAEHFDSLFTTEASIDALKQTILRLAVMGKLVPQDPNDEPACQTFSGLKPLLEEQDNLSSTQPAQWVSCSYRSVTSLVTSGSRGWKDFYSDSGAIFIRTQDIKTDRLVLDDVAFVNLPKTTEGMRSQVMQHDILITITGANVTKAARVESKIPEAYISQHIALTRPRWPAMSRWLHLCFTSRGSARGALEQLAYGAKPGLNLSNIRDLILPIPPLAEQHRIVAKVDELMALCDRLEADLAESLTRQARLSATLIESALQAA